MIRSPQNGTPNGSQELPKKNLPSIMMRRPGVKRSSDTMNASQSPPKPGPALEPLPKHYPVPEAINEVEIKPDGPVYQELTPMQPTRPANSSLQTSIPGQDEEEIDVTGMDYVDYGELLQQHQEQQQQQQQRQVVQVQPRRGRPPTHPQGHTNVRDAFATKVNTVKNSASTSSTYPTDAIDVVTVDEEPYRYTPEVASKRQRFDPPPPQRMQFRYPQAPPPMSKPTPSASIPTSSSSASYQQQQQQPPTRNVSYVDDDDDENFLKPIKITYLNEDGTEESEGLDGQFFCDKCPAVFRSRVGLTNHKKKHGANDLYRCNLCDFSCKNKKTTRYHRKVHLEIGGDAAYDDDE